MTSWQPRCSFSTFMLVSSRTCKDTWWRFKGCIPICTWRPWLGSPFYNDMNCRIETWELPYIIYIHLLCIECLWRSLNALGNIYIFRDQQQWGHGHNGLKRDSTHCFQDNMHQSMAKDSEDLSICQSFVQFYRVTRFQETNSVSKGFEPSLIVCHPLPQVRLRNSRNGWFRSNPNQLVKHIPNFLDYIPIFLYSSFPLVYEPIEMLSRNMIHIRRPLPSLGLGGAAPGITVGVRHGLVPALASKPQNLRSSFRRRAACLAMVPP